MDAEFKISQPGQPGCCHNQVFETPVRGGSPMCRTQIENMIFPRMPQILGLVSLVVLAVSLVPARAQNAPGTVPPSPAGRWKTIDDVTHLAKSIVVIREQNGTFRGTIEQIFDPPVPNPTCYLCSGVKKDRPLMGLEILWGFKRDGNRWSGGQVLDPETGKIYHASLSLEENGAKLRLHGYIGIPLFGRTQSWLRVQ
jgi:uncharacterized protein (DUF2147 family)